MSCILIFTSHYKSSLSLQLLSDWPPSNLLHPNCCPFSIFKASFLFLCKQAIKMQKALKTPAYLWK